MMLKTTTKTVHWVDYGDLNDFVNSYFGFEKDGDKPWSEYPYHFVAVEECGNDVSIEFWITGELDEWAVEYMDARIKSGGKAYIGNSQILNYLAARGVIAKGDYVVSVSW